MDPDFLFPETPESQCPVSKNTRKLSKDEAKEYIQWIESRIPNIDRKDERVYCAYCNMKNHPRWSCNHLSKHQNESAKHSCTLCIGDHPAFLRARAQVNHGIAKPNWARRETKLAINQHRAPDLRWDPQGILPPPPPPAKQPPITSSNGDIRTACSAMAHLQAVCVQLRVRDRCRRFGRSTVTAKFSIFYVSVAHLKWDKFIPLNLSDSIAIFCPVMVWFCAFLLHDNQKKHPDRLIAHLVAFPCPILSCY